jgi:hypothetical protein
MRRSCVLWFFLAIFLVLSACSGGNDTDPFSSTSTTDPTTAPDTTPYAIILKDSKQQVVKPDNTDSTVITATVIKGQIALADTVVTFSANAGLISTGSAITNSSGEATVTFKSGAMANGDSAIVTVTAGSTTETITIQAADTSLPATVNISASPLSVRTDDTETSTVTVTVLNASNGIMSGEEVSFQAVGGVLVGTNPALTGADGKATISFRSGTNKTNSAATITATAGTISNKVSIQVIGSTLAFSPSTTPVALAVGQKETLTVTAKDAAGNAVPAQTITFVDAGVGDVTISPATAITGIDGRAIVEVTGASLGAATLTITGLGATTTKVYEVSGLVGAEFFRITTPASEVSSGSLNTGFEVTVSAPAPTTQVLFATTLGTWSISQQNIQIVTVSAGIATAQLTSTLAGIATISASDKTQPSITDSATISFSANAATASKIVLQADPTVVATTVSNDAPQKVNLLAIVRNADDQVVGGAPVSFRIQNSTGGGEFISPPVVYTDAQGRAEATFTSGILSSSEGVTVTAALVDMPTVESSAIITIGGEPGSIALGRATVISALNATAYKLPMSALVSDGKGGPAAGVPISLTVWPVCYYASDFVFYPNEDLNEDVQLQDGEDLNNDILLTPPASTAGNIIPSPPISTDASGLANFDLIYLKANYNTYVRVKATANVSGTETTSTMYFHLPVLESDLKYLPNPTLPPGPSIGTCPQPIF